MGLVDDLGLGNALRKRRKSSYVIVITSNGTAKLDKPGVPENQWRVLNHLTENGPCPLRDLARELGMDEKRARSVCMRMEEDGYILRKPVV